MRKELIILSGFLGSGKTTLLRSLLLRHSDRKIAVLLNDFGDIPVDGETLRRSGVEGGVVVEIGGGSVFCSCLREPFIKALANLAARDEDLIIVEASGMSDPSAVDKMLRLSGLDGLFEHTSTICLFDPVKSLKLARVLEVIPRQLASASVVVLTKADITTKEERDAARAYIRSQEPDLPIVESHNGNADFASLPERALRQYPGDTARLLRTGSCQDRRQDAARRPDRRRKRAAGQGVYPGRRRRPVRLGYRAGF